jgi:hypothetical protein
MAANAVPKQRRITPNRVATALAVLAGIATAIAPVIADMDWTSTAGVIAGGLGAILAIGKWLDGWQKHEANVALTRHMTIDQV